MVLKMDFRDLHNYMTDTVASEFASDPDVLDTASIDVGKLPIEVRRWMRLEDVVVVVADLKASTSFSYSQRPASTGAIMEASVRSMTEILDRFGVDYMQAQGDGGFGIFWGPDRFERAICAAISVQTFSFKYLVPSIEQKWPTLPSTGFKVGVACGPVLVKRVGKARDLDRQDPVWVGRPVNYAAKCAQQTEPHRMLVTGSVWDRVALNDYLSMSCDCGSGPSLDIWKPHTIEKLRPDDPDASGRLLTTTWCETHGEDYCNAVLAGERVRETVTDLRSRLALDLRDDSFAKSRAAKRRDLRARRRGLGVL